MKFPAGAVSSSQQEFTSPCASAKKITFNFQYESYVTAIAAAVLNTSDPHPLYTKFYQYLSRA